MLHTLHLSPFHTDMAALLRLLAPGDDLLLIQDGVIAALGNNLWLTQLQAAPVGRYVLQEDVAARGIIAHISSDFILVNYTDFVALTQKHTHQLAW